jgi:hypothetical protein
VVIWHKVGVALVGVLVVAVTVYVLHGRGGDVPVTAPAPLLAPVVVGDRVMRVLDPANGLPGLSDEERRCAADRVNATPGLVESIEQEPATAPRLGELRAIVEGCRFVTSSLDGLRTGLVEGAHVTPDDAQVRCLASGLAAYPAAERDTVVQAGVAGVPPGAVRDRLGQLLTLCGIDGSALEP